MKSLKYLLGFAFAMILLFQQIDVVEAKGADVTVIQSGTYGENLTWILDDEGTLTISGEGDMEGFGNFGMPYFYEDEIRNVVLEAGITSIDSGAFRWLDNLESVTIPGTVRKIGYEAFAYCNSLQEIVIPESVEEIAEGAFYSCSGLKGIWVKEENTYYSSDENGILYNKDKTILITAPGSLQEIIIPEGVKKIEKNAFSDCYNLQEIIIPEGVEEIGENAFAACDELKSVTIPGSVKEIGDFAFQGCNSLKDISIQDGVGEIGEHAFYECDDLESVTIPGSVKEIGDCAFSGCRNLKSIVISEGVEEIGECAFYKCDDLESVTIPSSVKQIEGDAFFKCTSLKGIWVKEKNAYFSSDENGILYDKKKKTLITCPIKTGGEIIIPDSVECIGKEAFRSNQAESIVIPNSVKIIESFAFCSCSKIKEIVIPNSVTEIGDCAFGDCAKLKSVTIGRNVDKLGNRLFGWFVGDEGDDEIECVINKIKFLGKAPEFADESFPPRDITCYYPKNNSSWTKSVRKDYGMGNITWKGYEGTRYAPTVKAGNVSSSGKIKLTWSPANGAAKYKVYRATSKNGSYKLLGTTKGTVFTNTSATTGKTYYYYVKAVDSKGNNAKKSNTVSKTCDLARPNVTAKLNSKGKPSLTWKKVSGASKYEVYRATSEDGKYSLLKTVKGTLFINTGANKGAKYYYKVKAIHSKSSANSAYSTVVSIKSK